MTHIHWVTRQNKLEISTDKDEVNKRKIRECDGRAHDPDTMVAPLRPNVFYFIYYESIQREIKTRLMKEKTFPIILTMKEKKSLFIINREIERWR